MPPLGKTGYVPVPVADLNLGRDNPARATRDNENFRFSLFFTWRALPHLAAILVPSGSPANRKPPAELDFGLRQSADPVRVL
jgi:hypothetical protein